MKMVYRDITRSGVKALLLLTLAGLVLFAGCKTQKVETYWAAETVKIDGEMTEWASTSTSYFEEVGVQLGLCNDTQNLYVLFRFTNQDWARAIRMGGVTLWLDNSGKKKKDLGIRYTGGPSISDLQKPGMSGEGGFRESLTPEQEQRLQEMEKNMADQITVIDKKSNQEITLSADGSGGPAVCFASPQGTYTYEFSIPLKKGDVFDFGFGAEPGQTICLGLEWGGMGEMDREKMKKMGGGPPGGMGGMPPGGMGGGPPGGMGGGRGGGPGGRPGMQKSEEQELWVKTQLASPAEE
jgi:hypothetical protein